MSSNRGSASQEPSAGGTQPQLEGRGQGRGQGQVGVQGEARLPAAWASGVFAASEGRLGALRCGAVCRLHLGSWFG